MYKNNRVFRTNSFEQIKRNFIMNTIIDFELTTNKKAKVVQKVLKIPMLLNNF